MHVHVHVAEVATYALTVKLTSLAKFSGVSKLESTRTDCGRW